MTLDTGFMIRMVQRAVNQVGGRLAAFLRVVAGRQASPTGERWLLCLKFK